MGPAYPNILGMSNNPFTMTFSFSLALISILELFYYFDLFLDSDSFTAISLVVTGSCYILIWAYLSQSNPGFLDKNDCYFPVSRIVQLIDEGRAMSESDIPGHLFYLELI
jgi:hypothetical protein